MFSFSEKNESDSQALNCLVLGCWIHSSVKSYVVLIKGNLFARGRSGRMGEVGVFLGGGTNLIAWHKCNCHSQPRCCILFSGAVLLVKTEIILLI